MEVGNRANVSIPLRKFRKADDGAALGGGDKVSIPLRKFRKHFMIKVDRIEDRFPSL